MLFLTTWNLICSPFFLLIFVLLSVASCRHLPCSIHELSTLFFIFSNYKIKAREEAVYLYFHFIDFSKGYGYLDVHISLKVCIFFAHGGVLYSFSLEISFSL